MKTMKARIGTILAIEVTIAFLGFSWDKFTFDFWGEDSGSTVFDDEHGLYGAKRIAASLKEDTAYTPVNHKKVARIMKAMGLQGFSKRRRCITTRRKPDHRVMPDLLGRIFTAELTNETIAH